MSQYIHTFVGIDIGDEKNGFHAVVLQGNTFVDKIASTKPAEVVAWCLAQKAAVVAVDAPCGWSKKDSSRQAERNLKIGTKPIYCFSTPTRKHAENHSKGFYDWVFNGEKLYRLLVKHYPLFKGKRLEGPACIETFPQAVACAMEGKKVSAKNKATVRRRALTSKGYNICNLSNIDFVDAALCAVAAYDFGKGNYQSFGNREEGFIVVPKTCAK